MKSIFIFLFALCSAAHGYELACDGTDTTAAFNQAVADVIASPTDKIINLSAGQCYFSSQPATLTAGIAVLGQGKSVTVLRRSYSGSFFRVTGQGVRIKDLTIFADQGTSGGIGIEMTANNSAAGGNHVISSVWITGLGTWVIPLGAWGHERTIAPAGIRAITLQDVSVFNATWQAVTLWGCVSCEWFGGGAYQGFGTTQAIVIGGTNSYKNFVSANVDWTGSTVYPGVLRKADQ